MQMESYIFQAGRKSFDFIRIPGVDHFEFQFLERYKGRVHEVKLSFREVLWVCDWMEKAPEIKGSFWKKRQERKPEIVIGKESNYSGSFLRIIAAGLGRAKEVIIPEIVENCGRGWLVGKIRRFSTEYNNEKKKPLKSYKEAAVIPPWPNLELKISHGSKDLGVDFVVEEDSCEGILRFLERCLVGRVGGLDFPIPSKDWLQNWVDQRWRTAGGVRVVDMNGKFFLFEFPSKEEAGRILREKNWYVQQEPLFLDKWDPVGCCHREGRKPGLWVFRCIRGGIRSLKQLVVAVEDSLEWMKHRRRETICDGPEF